MNTLRKNIVRHSGDISASDRFIAACSYLTLGTIGFVWFILNMFILKKAFTRFLMCNLIQSFVLAILYAILSLVLRTFFGILAAIPYLGKIFLNFMIFISAPIFHTLSLINAATLLFLAYLALFSLFGKLPYIPFITDIAKKNCA